MKFDNTQLEGITIHYEELEQVMNSANFYPVYDYERVTFDYKLMDKENEATYYLRVQGVAIEGEIPAQNSVVKLMKPILGRHYYPHGVEYDEDFPEKVIKRCNNILNKIQKEIVEESFSS